MEFIVTIHSIWRWAVLLTGVGALVLSIMSATGSRPWDALTDRFSLFFTIALDVQFLIGAVVWLTGSRWNGANAYLSFFHPILMLAAIAIAHAGRTRADKATGGKAKGTQATIFFGVSLLVILLAIPLAAWPL